MILVGLIGLRRERRLQSALVEQLLSAGGSEGFRQSSAVGSKSGLPVPVARYLDWALPQGKRILSARLQQAGILRTDARSDRWMSFEAEHLVAPPAVGFAWNARVAVAPFVHVRVRDALVAGQGSGRVSLLSAFLVAADGGTAEMNSGSLHRYLAEAVWYPTALLPSAKLRWSAIDENRALATLTEGGTTVTLEFRFADTGEVTGIYTPARWGSFDRGYKRLPWEGHFRNYEEVQGMVVPMEGEVGWYLEEEWQPVWRGRVTSASYELVR